MDATAQLALMVKAKRVFESPGTFLSFPLAPLAYPPEVLDFGKALGDPKTGAALLEYSRAVNQCPLGAIFQGDSDQYLWEHYDRWLNAMALAHGDLSPDQEAAYAAAHALLRAADASGLETDSPALSLYKLYRDRHLNAVQAYKAAQITAGSAATPSAQAQWHDVDEPRLRQAVDAAAAEWASAGGKAAIEAAQATVAASEARMPQKVWEAWRHAYNPDLDVFVDAASSGSCAPSGFAPANVAAQPWTTFVLTGPEIKSLVADASDELKSIFGQTGASEITSLSFEFRSAAVVRPWFNSAMFDARFWKFADDAPDLSDGGTPPQGAWPAYVSAVVFARKIRVTMQAAPPQPLAALPAIMLRPETLAIIRDHRAAPPPARAAAPIAAAAALTFARVAFAPRPAQPAAPPLQPVAAMALRAAMAPRPAGTDPVQRLNTAMVYRAPMPPGRPPMVPPIAPHPPMPPPQAVPQPQPQPASPPPPPDERISILAFICRPLRKVPDPDPALDWSA